jgi:hypothetical protein
LRGRVALERRCRRRKANAHGQSRALGRHRVVMRRRHRAKSSAAVRSHTGTREPNMAASAPRHNRVLVVGAPRVGKKHVVQSGFLAFEKAQRPAWRARRRESERGPHRVLQLTPHVRFAFRLAQSSLASRTHSAPAQRNASRPARYGPLTTSTTAPRSSSASSPTTFQPSPPPM